MGANLLSGEREYLMTIKFMGPKLYFVSASPVVNTNFLLASFFSWLLIFGVA